MIQTLATVLGVQVSDPAFWLPLVFFAAFFVVSFFGLLLDGFDIGVGCLAAVTPVSLHARMFSLLNPWRDANELWLFMGVGLLATVFPTAFGVIFGQLYIPLCLLALGFFLRSVCFELRLRAPQKQQPIWALGFILGSLVLAFSHGLLVAQIIVNGQWQKGYFWFSLLIGVCALASYLLLGATWLIMRDSSSIRIHSIIWAQRAGRWFAAGLVAASVVLALENAGVFLKWTESVNRWLVYSYWAVIIACFVILEMNLQRLKQHQIKRTLLPFVLTLFIFWLTAFGFIFSYFPFFVLDEVTIWDAAAPETTLYLISLFALFALPFIIVFNFWVYWRVFGLSKPPLVPEYEHPASHI